MTDNAQKMMLWRSALASRLDAATVKLDEGYRLQSAELLAEASKELDQIFAEMSAPPEAGQKR